MKIIMEVRNVCICELSRNDFSVASCYYFNPKNKLITDKKEYYIK